MRYRSIVSLAIAFGFLAISITGLFLYFGLKSEAIEIIHVLFGLLFVGFVVFHIRYNFDAIKNYSLVRKGRTVRKEFAITLTLAISLLVWMSLGFPLMEDLSHAGRALFEGKRTQRRHDGVLTFNLIETNQTIKGTSLRFRISLGKQVVAPVIVIWVADSAEGRETLFLPTKVINLTTDINNYWDFEKREVMREIQYVDFNPKMLIEFNKQRNIPIPNYIKSTPVSNFILNTNTHLTGDFTIYIEIKFGNRIELYRTGVETISTKVFLLRTDSNTLINEGIVTVAD